MWVLFDPAYIAHGGQFETLAHTEYSLDQEIIDGEHQQQWSMTFDVMEASEGEKN